MVFRSYYKTKPKNFIPQQPPPELKRPAVLPKSSSIKINSKPALQRPVAHVPSSNDTIVATPKPRAPSISPPGVARPSEAAAPSVKRPHPDKEQNHSPAPKRPKIESKASSQDVRGERRKRRMVTLKTRNPKRLALILGQSMGPSTNGRTSLPSGAPKEQSPSVRDSITAKPVRKPLPTGERKPLPGGPSQSPPALANAHVSASVQASAPLPKLSINTSARPSPSSQGGSPGPSTPASSRPKIKIKIKAQQSQLPPAP